jgi:hypothetical protein
MQFNLELDGSFRRHSWQIIEKHIQKLSDYMNLLYLPLHHVMYGCLDARNHRKV